MHSDALHGRTTEAAAIDAALEQLDGGAPTLVAVSGEPGIGKTRLLRLLAARAQEREMLVLGAAGAEWDGGAPFGPVGDALDDHLAGLDAPRLAVLRATYGARLSPLLPALDGGPEAAADRRPDGDERHLTLRALRGLLEALAARRPLVLVFDDLHWVDPSTLELVTYLTRRRPRGRVLLAIAYRPRALARFAGTTRAAFLASSAEILLEPRPLHREEAAALVGHRVAPGRIDALVAESGGNPFYLQQLAGSERRAAAQPHGDLDLDLGAGVPDAVAGALAAELGRLTPEARAVCRAAAVAGDPFEPHLVAAAAGLEEPVVLAALDELVREGTICTTELPRRLRFRHPIVRRAAYHSAEPGARLTAHRRLADVLERSGAHPLERAQHVAAAAVRGDADAVGLLAEAARAASRRSPAVAARWYAAALALLPARTALPERIGLMVATATAQGAAGQLEESRSTLTEVLDALPAEMTPLRHRILPFLAMVGHMLGRHGEATALLRRAMDELDDPLSAQAAELGISTALDCMYEPDPVGMARYAADADRAARLAGDPALEAAGAGVLALAGYHAGDLTGAAAACDRAVTLLGGLEDRELSGRLEGVLSVALAAANLERHDESFAISDRGLSISHVTGQGHLLVPLGITRAIATAWHGELAAAAADADEVVDLARLSHIGQWVAWALTLRGWIAVQAGELELAAECGEEACAITDTQARPTYYVAHARFHLAETRLAQGRPEECRALLLAAAGGPELPVCERPTRPRYFEILTRAALELGDLDDARKWARRADAAAAGSPLGGRRAEAALAVAAVRLAEGDHLSAEARALEAAAAARSAGDRVLAARSQLLAARACAPRSREVAVAGLEAVRTELEACGAARLGEQAVRELRRLGRRVGGGGGRGEGTHGAAALSRREREVAELVTHGLTNRQIADRLVLSDRTIETHLSAVFRKLDVPGRAAVATALWPDHA